MSDWKEIATGIVLLALLIVAIVFGVKNCAAQVRCVRAGGRVENYDCYTQYEARSCGSNCTIIVPQEYCSWRCVGASPEQAP